MAPPTKPPAEQVLDNYLKAATALDKVKAVTEWPDGVDGSAIVEATELYANLMRDAVLQRMAQPTRGRPVRE